MSRSIDGIDRNAMLARLEEWNTSDSTDKALYNFTLHRILEQPTIELRKKGKWIKITTGAMREKYMCSICDRTIEDDGIERLVQIRYPFCHCGADMTEGEG